MDDKTWKEIWEQILLLMIFWPVSALVGLTGYMVRKVRKRLSRSMYWCAACGTAGSLSCAGWLAASPGSYQKAFWTGLAVSFMMGLSGSRDLPEILGLAIRVLSAIKREERGTGNSDSDS